MTQLRWKTSPGMDSRLLPLLIAGVAFALLALRLLYQAGSPIWTDDLWWHLRLGEEYTANGPWLEADPLLYTAVDGAPPPHAWLFDVAVSAVDRTLGLHGLRGAHALAVLLIVGLAFSIFRRESGAWLPALAATALFLVLAQARLVRLRPDLVSILCVLLSYRLLLEGDAPPSWRRVAAAVLLFVVWANSHALFALGPLLVIAALFGLLLRAGLLRFASPGGRGAAGAAGSPPAEEFRARRLAAALVMGLVAALLNPRGIGQHLSFLSSASGSALRAIQDDWSPFAPFSWSPERLQMDFASWLAADLVLLGFLIGGGLALVRAIRKPNAETLRAADPVLMALGSASFAAILVSQRFLWLSVFLLLSMLRPLSCLRSEQLGRVFAWAFSLLCVAMAFAFPRAGELGALDPGRLRAYFERPFSVRYPAGAVDFLARANLEGNLFSRYATGGFFGYWLAPGVRSFVNGSMNFPADVFEDYFAVLNSSGVRPGEGVGDLLERRGIDLFVGAGAPEARLRGPARFYTTAALEAEPGWIQIHRSLDNAIYLRLADRNLENLRRVADYYEGEGIPFDPQRGLDVGLVLRVRSEWAIGHGMLPQSYRELLASRSHAEPALRYRALERLALIHLLLGDYEAQLRLDRQSVALKPRAEAARRRMIYGLLRLGRGEQALQVARELARVGSNRAASVAFARAAELQVAAEGAAAKGEAPDATHDTLERRIQQLPVVSHREYLSVLRLVAPPPPLSRTPNRR